MRAEVARLRAGRERRGGRREQDLAAVARGRDPRGADHIEARVPLLAELGDTGVEAHPNLHREAVGPLVIADRGLALERRRQRGLDLLEDRRELVPGRIDLRPPVRADRLPQEAPHVGDDARVGRPRRLDELRRAFDVRKQERHGAGGQRAHRGESTSGRRYAGGWCTEPGGGGDGTNGERAHRRRSWEAGRLSPALDAGKRHRRAYVVIAQG